MFWKFIRFWFSVFWSVFGVHKKSHLVGWFSCMKLTLGIWLSTIRSKWSSSDIGISGARPIYRALFLWKSRSMFKNFWNEGNSDVKNLKMQLSRKKFVPRLIYPRRDPRCSMWWEYVLGGTWADPSRRDGKSFRARFRTTHEFFMNLVVQAKELFPNHEKKDALGRRPGSTELNRKCYVQGKKNILQ